MGWKRPGLTSCLKELVEMGIRPGKCMQIEWMMGLSGQYIKFKKFQFIESKSNSSNHILILKNVSLKFWLQTLLYLYSNVIMPNNKNRKQTISTIKSQPFSNILKNQKAFRRCTQQRCEEWGKNIFVNYHLLLNN